MGCAPKLLEYVARKVLKLDTFLAHGVAGYVFIAEVSATGFMQPLPAGKLT
jgi:hypothetical protein